MTIARWIFAVLAVGLVAMVAMSSLQPRPRPPTQVQTAVATRMSITRSVSGAGKIEPVHKVNVSSNITGTLLSLEVAVGSKVTKGEPLGQIDTSLYKSQVEQQEAALRATEADVKRARANLDYLTREAKRLQQMLADGVASEADVTGAVSSRDLAAAELAATQSRAAMSRAALAEARSSLGWATLKAPIDGTVLAVNHRVGERVRGSDFAEDVILVLGSLSEVDVRFEVGEYDVVYIKPGQTAVVEIDAFGAKTYPGIVIDSGRDAIVKNEGTENEVTTFPVWVSLADPPPRTLSGMSAQVTIATETHDGVVAVPIQAVTVRPAEDGPADAAGVASHRRKLDKVVFVVADGAVHKRIVEVGLSSETHVEILAGLDEGETVVEGPYRTLARDLTDGQPVAAAPADH
ncbi:MAG: efflux RND transporter periplasmic adaptor subunit [Kofleriaceae bacterium]|nr:efflux RND transporter periplasmic adaptor subunit [Myxococcales bacterium]MCB9562478.1 efflux RND transporter periplasmic adaptor subunit [Kofleriaceae bacterium]MCB9570763.1 efflux RND transporter periplasmic adaptor subunit [Kofleriaceae bacterium]